MQEFDLSTKGFETKSIRTQTTRSHNKEHSVPLYLTSSFTFDNAEHGGALFSGEVEGNLYSRFSNPNADEFANKLAVLEGAEAGIATATGMSAVYTTLISLLQPGDHIVSSRQVFGNTLNVINQILPKWGVESTQVDINNQQAWIDAIHQGTKLFFVETPANPTLDIIDLEWICSLAHAHDILVVVDNCFATPYLQQPIKFGADVVVHSATKFIDGQGRVLGGGIVGKKELVDKCYEFLRCTGSSISPFNAWVLSKCLETLGVRMDRHSDNAMKLASYLQEIPQVRSVIYPHLSTFNNYTLAKKQLKRGGGLVAFYIADGDERAARFLNKLKLLSLTANLGDTRSIVTHPASTTHSKLSENERKAAGIHPGLVRVSVGLETIDDIIDDIEVALVTSR